MLFFPGELSYLSSHSQVYDLFSRPASRIPTNHNLPVPLLSGLMFSEIFRKTVVRDFLGDCEVHSCSIRVLDSPWHPTAIIMFPV